VAAAVSAPSLRMSRLSITSSLIGRGSCAKLH
jgi:hypothetical protein